MKAASLRLALLVGAAGAFSSRRLPLPRPRPPPPPPSSSAAVVAAPASAGGTALRGRKRRGGLADDLSLDLDDGPVAAAPPAPTKARRRPKASRGGGGGDDAAISPLLAAWAREEESAIAPPVGERQGRAAATAADADADAYAPFSPEKKRRKGGRGRDRSGPREARSALAAAQAAQEDGLLDEIAGMVNVTNCDVRMLVSRIAALADLPASVTNDRVLLPTLKSLLSVRPDESKGKRRPAYRLAWVGSDAAICHVGTSLHKVPLARLQEMYLLLGYGKWELLEVIRILGPFPNVRNTLQGEVQAKRRASKDDAREGAMLRVTYTSMIDGTGKELLAGTDAQTVDLDVWYASERALVCTVPREETEGGDKGEDPLAGDGADVLLFVAEEDVDGQLEKLRAA